MLLKNTLVGILCFTTKCGYFNMLKQSFIFIINCYKFLISPLLPKSCRFFPSCSDYAKLAIKDYGVILGTYLMIKRLLKCHPFNDGGYDPVPKRKVKI